MTSGRQTLASNTITYHQHRGWQWRSTSAGEKLGSAEDVVTITRCTVARNTARQPSRTRQKISHPTLAVMKSNSSDASIIVNQKTNLSLSIPGRRERLDLNKLGFKIMRMWSLIATLDKIQPHQITMKSRVIVEPPPARMSINIYVEQQNPIRPT